MLCSASVMGLLEHAQPIRTDGIPTGTVARAPHQSIAPARPASFAELIGAPTVSLTETGPFPRFGTATEFWSELIQGRWQVVHRVDTSAYRYILARGSAPKRRLTVRERQVLDLVVAGATDKQVSETLDLSVSTVATHRSRAIEKVGLGSLALTTQLAWAARLEDTCSCVPTEVWAERAARGEFRVIRLPRLASRLPKSLSEAERAVAGWLTDGLSNREIADARKVSERTVANQIRSIFYKIGVGRRADLVVRLCRCDQSCAAAVRARQPRPSAAEPAPASSSCPASA